MQWVCYIEIQGLYAGAAQDAGLVPAGRPVVVLKGGQVFDGCRQAFVSGLVLGTPARQAMRDAPGAIQVELEQVNASARARAWWDRCLEHTPYIEPLQLHQVYLALPTPGDALTQALRTEVARLLAVAAALGFVAFAGVGSAKLVARAAALSCREGWLLRRPGAPARAAAPEAASFVASGAEERFLAALPVGYLPAPPEVKRRLARLGLRTIGEAAKIPESEWLRQLGPLGRQVALWSRGIDPEQVKPCYPPRALARRVQFQPEVRDRDHLEAVISRSAAMLAKQLDAKGEGCQHVSLRLEQAAGPPLTAARTLAKLQQAPYPFQQALVTLLGSLLQAETAVTALAVELSLIGPMPWQQLDLWADHARRERDERLQRALTLLHERFPVRMAAIGHGGEVSWREQMLGFNDPYRYAGERP